MIKKMGFEKTKQPYDFYAQKKIISDLNEFTEAKPEKAKSLQKLTLQYTDLLKKLNFRHWVLQKGKFSAVRLIGELLLAILFLPIFLYGSILNYIPYKIPVWVTKKIKDPQFISSFRTVVALILFPVYYIILAIVGANVFNSFWLTLSFILTVPLTGLFAFQYYIRIKKWFAKVRFNFMQWFKNSHLLELKKIYSTIIYELDKITNN